MKVCILGQGYIGLPTALMFATHGIDVVGVDVDQEILNTLLHGGLHIQEPGLKEYFDQAILSGHLTFSCDATKADAFIITVPTPFLQGSYGEYQGRIHKKADMRFVECAAEMVWPRLRKGNLVVLESTSPPRTTTGLVQPILERSGLKAGKDFSLVYCPERVLPGKILQELVENARVIGGVDRVSAEAGRDLYSHFVKGEILLTDATTAEMVKLMENTYRDVNIAVANEFAYLADRFDVDIWEAIRIANHHPRVKILSPGIGVGGHCISVDPWFLVESAPDLTRLISAARQVNDSRPAYITRLVSGFLSELGGKNIAALGLAFKPNVDDLRESPAVEICCQLAAAGANVKAFEPFKPDAQFEGFATVPSLETAVRDADLILVLVAHQQFRLLTPEAIASSCHAKTIVDAVNIWNAECWRSWGFQYQGIGLLSEDRCHA